MAIFPLSTSRNGKLLPLPISMEDKPHIAFLAAWYPDEHDPMFGLFVQKHAHLLTGKFRVSVLHFTYYSHQPNRISVHTSQGIEVTTVNISTRNKILKWLHFVIAGQKAYRHIISRQGKPVVNHVHILTRMGVLAAMIKCRYRIPYVITEHWSRYFPVPGTYRNFLRKCLTRCVCRKAAALSAVSDRLEAAMKKHRLGVHKPWVRIHNVVDENVFFPVHLPPAIPIRMLNISCFEDQSKNLSGLITAVKSLVQEGLPVELVLGGTGQDFEKMKQLVVESGLEKCVILAGLLTEAQVAGWMQRSHFYVQPSHYENVPVVISEALLSGLPVVATNVGGLSEMIDEQNGYLVEPGRPESLVAAIKLMCEQYRDFDPAAIRGEAMKKYSTSAVRTQMEQLYAKVIS